MTEPRLVKYGRPRRVGPRRWRRRGSGSKPERGVRGVALGREVDLGDERLDGGGEAPGDVGRGGRRHGRTLGPATRRAATSSRYRPPPCPPPSRSSRRSRPSWSRPWRGSSRSSRGRRRRPRRPSSSEIVSGDATVFFAARVDGRIVGSLTLVVFRIPTGVRAWIEDVVVDDAARGAGVGEALNRAAVDEAHRRGARTVDLTSRPSREAANRLYQRMGFVARDTTVYRWSGDDQDALTPRRTTGAAVRTATKRAIGGALLSHLVLRWPGWPAVGQSSAGPRRPGGPASPGRSGPAPARPAPLGRRRGRGR